QKSIEDMTKTVEKLVDNMRQRVVGWWDDMKKSVTETAGNLVSGVTGFFQNLYDTLVGHSIVPDLATETVNWFGWMSNRSTGIVGQMANTLTGQFGQGYSNI